MKYINQLQDELPVGQNLEYPDIPAFKHPLEAPCRFEGEVYSCTVYGQVPKEVNGTFYRVMPDTVWAPIYEDDIFINGDGCIDAVRFENGHVDFKQRFVRTNKFLVERAARRAVFGKYRNRYTDDVRLEGQDRTTANTHVMYYDGQLLAMKEDARPYALDPDTLETKGQYDFDGQFKSLTHTAHPKIDPTNGEFMTMGYEAKGDTTIECAYYRFDKNGRKLDEFWFNAPFKGLTHDWGVTEHWIVAVFAPFAVVPLELMKAGHRHFAWDNEKPVSFVMFPRHNPKPEDVKYFHWKNCYILHVANAFEDEDGIVNMDVPIAHGNIFYFFPPIGEEAIPHKIESNFNRFKFDPRAKDSYVEPELLLPVDGELPRIDERYLTRPYNVAFYCLNDETCIRNDTVIGASFNSIARFDLKEKTYEYWCAGPGNTVGEVVFCPRSPDAPEGDGYLITTCSRGDTMLTSILIVDALKIAEGPIAIVQLPFRLRMGIHGSWVPASGMKEKKPLCDMQGISQEMIDTFGTGALQLPQLHKLELNKYLNTN